MDTITRAIRLNEKMHGVLMDALNAYASTRACLCMPPEAVVDVHRLRNICKSAEIEPNAEHTAPRQKPAGERRVLERVLHELTQQDVTVLDGARISNAVQMLRDDLAIAGGTGSDETGVEISRYEAHVSR